jgi:hypothetical protein
MFYILFFCNLYLSVFAIKNSYKIYFTVNPFVFGLYEPLSTVARLEYF